MVKFSINLLFVFLLLSTYSFAINKDAPLQKEYGPDLTHIPFFLRFTFYQKFGKDWVNSDYLERKNFLTDYDKQTAADKAKEAADAKAEAEHEKELIREKKAELYQEKEKIRLEKQEAREQKLAEIKRQRDFDALVHSQELELKKLEQESVVPKN